MSGIKLAMVQMDIVHEPMANAERFLREARAAVAAGANIVVGSEMMLTQYISGDRYEDDGFIAEMWEAAMYIVKASAEIDAVLIFGGIAIDVRERTFGEDGRLRKYNAGFIAQHGKLVKNQAGMEFAVKSLMPNYRYFDDSRHFFDLRKVAAERGVPLEALLQPFVVTINGQEVNLGVILCEDMWHDDYAHNPGLTLAEHGADILIGINSSPWGWQKNRKRDQMVAALCRVTGLAFVYVNNMGVQNNGKNFMVFDGASTIYDPEGGIIAMAPRYVEETTVVDFSKTLPLLERKEMSDVAEQYTAIRTIFKAFVDTLPAHLRKMVVAVSGGKDSTATLGLGVDVLGKENILALTMPYVGYTSDETLNDTRELANRFGVELLEIPINDIVDAMCLAAGIEKGTSQFKTAMAMARLQLHAAVAAQRGMFFTSNGNMTEIAFGYFTLNADGRGVFAPWANCLAQDVYRILDHMNRVVFLDTPIPQSIVDRRPMDELTAMGSGERDDPFDYGDVKENGYHDQMVRALVAFRRSPEWFLHQYLSGTLCGQLQVSETRFKKLLPNAEAFVEDLERCMRLFYAGIFKRVQSVPCAVVDKRSFGFDLRESIQPWVVTRRFTELKKMVLASDSERMVA